MTQIVVSENSDFKTAYFKLRVAVQLDQLKPKLYHRRPEIHVNLNSMRKLLKLPKLPKLKIAFSEATMTLIAAIVGGLIASFAGIGSSLYVLHKQNSVEQLMFANSLTQSFYNNKVFSDIRTSLDQCEELYFGYGGKYSHDQINLYLGFFEDLGFFVNRKEFVDLDVVIHLFGAHLVEAYSYPETRRYVMEIQKHQPFAFTELDDLFSAIVTNSKDLKDLADNMETACNV